MRIIIVEDHSLLAELLKKVCTNELRAEVVATETHGGPALEAVRIHKPDLVILDLSLPDMDGCDVAKAIIAELPATRILVVSSYRDSYTLSRLRELGIHGYLDKREPSPAVLGMAVERVMSGKGYFSAAYNDVLNALKNDPEAFHRMLSQREQTLLKLFGESKTDEEIATILNIRPATALSYRRDIMGKLGIHSTPKLIRYAIELGFEIASI